jgi:hypothetical protein
MSAGKTTVFQAAKGKCEVETFLLQVADIAAAPAAEFTRYNWSPVDSDQLLGDTSQHWRSEAW